MPDRLIVSQVGVEGLESFTVGGGLEWLLDDLDVEYDRESVAVVTNEKPGEDDDATSYFVTRYDLEDVPLIGSDVDELFECTCPAFRYQQVPKPDHVADGTVGLEQIGECKHLEEYRKRSRSTADRDESQSGLEDVLDGDGGGFA